MYIEFFNKRFEQNFFAKWFSWIEWLTLTALLLGFGFKKELLILKILGGLSLLFLYEYTFRCCLNTLIQILNKFNIDGIARKIIAAVIGLPLPLVVFIPLGIAIWSLISAT